MKFESDTMNVPELELGAQEHVVYRHAAWIEKRSGSFPWFWRSRFVVVSRNFLFEYSSNSVRGVRVRGPRRGGTLAFDNIVNLVSDISCHGASERRGNEAVSATLLQRVAE